MALGEAGWAADKGAKDAPNVWESPPVQVEDLLSLRISTPVFYARHTRSLPVTYRLPEPPARAASVATTREAAARVSDGYRVQVFSGNDQSTARSMEKKLRDAYQNSVYVVYEAPQYKVRLGDFANREDAAQLCKQLKRSGYLDAWVVKSQVTVSP